jgi:two-component system, cell cycle sensor histidine kinase and response regulator CckA
VTDAEAREPSARALIARALYGICRETVEGRFLDANPALVALLGYESPEALLAVDIAAAIYRDPPERAALVADVLAGRLTESADMRWRTCAGTPITVRISMQAARDSTTGEVLWLESIIEPITERQRREELLRRSERLASVGKLVSGFAHELNNPLAAISGFAKLIDARMLSAEDQDALGVIHAEAMRAGRIVQDLVTFSRRPEQDVRGPVDVAAVVRTAVAAEQPAIAALGVALHLAIEPSLPAVAGQAPQLEHVVRQLLGNARQAMARALTPVSALPARPLTGRLPARHSPEPPAIHVAVRTRPSSVVLEVSDNGPGIPVDQQPRIWDPFWTTRDSQDALGLGLSVAHAIVTGYDGTIEVDGTEGYGTRFTVTLPTMDDGPDTLR